MLDRRQTVKVPKAPSHTSLGQASLGQSADPRKRGFVAGGAGSGRREAGW